MVSEKEIDDFVKSQDSLHLYSKARKALKQVLSKIPDKEYYESTKNLIIMALTESDHAQVMRFKIKGEFKVMQLTLKKDMSIKTLQFVIAHELAHCLQKIDFMNAPYNHEKEADRIAESWGFRR